MPFTFLQLTVSTARKVAAETCCYYFLIGSLYLYVHLQFVLFVFFLFILFLVMLYFFIFLYILVVVFRINAYIMPWFAHLAKPQLHLGGAVANHGFNLSGLLLESKQ